VKEVESASGVMVGNSVYDTIPADKLDIATIGVGHRRRVHCRPERAHVWLFDTHGPRERPRSRQTMVCRPLKRCVHRDPPTVERRTVPDVCRTQT